MQHYLTFAITKWRMVRCCGVVHRLFAPNFVFLTIFLSFAVSITIRRIFTLSVIVCA